MLQSCWYGLALATIICWTSGSSAEDKAVPEGFESLFNGQDLSGWRVNEGGNLRIWGADNGVLFVSGKGGGWLLTEKEYSDFELRLEYKMPERGNSGVALRAPVRGDPAYVGMEIQLLDDPSYKGLRPAQHTGSIYDVVPASQQVSRPVGQWNSMHIVAKARHVTVELNGARVVDADLDHYRNRSDKHPGLLRTTGHLGLQSHDGRVEFRNLYVKPL
jgi:hypothetical protein